MSAPAMNVPGLPDVNTSPASCRDRSSSSTAANSCKTGNDRILAPLPGRSNLIKAMSGSGKESERLLAMRTFPEVERNACQNPYKVPDLHATVVHGGGEPGWGTATSHTLVQDCVARGE